MILDVRKYYQKFVLIPAGISVLINILLSISHYDSKFKSEWLTIEAVIGLSIVLALVNGIIISILSSTIFLNKRKDFIESSFLRFLSWFFVPLFWIGFLIKLFLHACYQPSDTSGDDPWFFLPFFLPNLIGLILGYFLFEKEIKTIKNTF